MTSARPPRISTRAVVVASCRRWLEPNSGLLYPLLSALDDHRTNRYRYAVPVGSSGGRWVGYRSQHDSNNCCELVLDTWLGEWRKVPTPGANVDSHILAMTPSRVVWSAQAPSAPLQESRLTSLPHAITIVRHTRHSGRLVFSFRHYGTPGTPEIHVFDGRAWRAITDDRRTRTTISVADRPGRHWYRIYKGGFVSRRVVA